MKKGCVFIAVVLLLFIAAGCSTVEQASPEPPTAPAELSISDLDDILGTLDVASSSLAYHGEAEEAYPADAAICAEDYQEELKGFAWETYSPPSELDENDAEFYRLDSPNATITTFLGRYDSNHPIHLVTDDGDGWFVLPQAEADTVTQTNIIYTIFSSWYNEARTASLCGGSGSPLTSEELKYFRQYTESTRTGYDAEHGGYDYVTSTEISCFFTSFYDDVRKLNFEEFMRYFPGDRSAPAQTTEAEFKALKQVDDWPFTEVESLDNMPVPIHKYPRSRVDSVLMKYAGITTAELDTAGVAYLKEYDAFYNYSSDFGPGSFIPYYGEKDGNIVTLWDTPVGYDGSANGRTHLTLQKSGEDWHILSYQVTETS